MDPYYINYYDAKELRRLATQSKATIAVLLILVIRSNDQETRIILSNELGAVFASLLDYLRFSGGSRP